MAVNKSISIPDDLHLDIQIQQKSTGEDFSNALCSLARKGLNPTSASDGTKFPMEKVTETDIMQLSSIIVVLNNTILLLQEKEKEYTLLLLEKAKREQKEQELKISQLTDDQKKYTKELYSELNLIDPNTDHKRILSIDFNKMQTLALELEYFRNKYKNFSFNITASRLKQYKEFLESNQNVKFD